MCSEVMGLTSSTKTASKEYVSSPSSGLALRNLGKSDGSDEEDDLERLLNENGDQDDVDFQLKQDTCNGFNVS